MYNAINYKFRFLTVHLPGTINELHTFNSFTDVNTKLINL